MGVNLAARPGAKANRRKAIVAEKRKLAVAEATPAGLALRGATLSIRCCLLNENIFETGMGKVVLMRGFAVGPVVAGAFLLDTYCRGVKDCLLHPLEGKEVELFLDRMSEATPMVQVDPSYARKLLRDVVQWSGSLGFPPHRDFKAFERLFGDVDLQSCDTSFRFGLNGKPLYMSGPNDSPAVARWHIEQLREQVGGDKFDYMVAI